MEESSETNSSTLFQSLQSSSSKPHILSFSEGFLCLHKLIQRIASTEFLLYNSRREVINWNVVSKILTYSFLFISHSFIQNNLNPLTPISMKLKVLPLGLTFGVLGAFAMIIMTIAAMYFNYGMLFTDFVMSIYPFYEVSWFGVLIGGLGGFLDGLIGGVLVASLYNGFSK